MSPNAGMSISSKKQKLDAKHAALALALNFSAMGTADAQPVGNSPLTSYTSYGSPCQQSQVKAILDSKRPWPNEVRDKTGTLIKFDFWIGPLLFEIPANQGIEATWGGNGPARYGIAGNAAQIVSFPAKEHHRLQQKGIGATLYGRIECQSHLPSSEWIENTAPNKPTRDELVKDITSRFDMRMYSGARLVERGDIGMVEISYIPKILGGIESVYYIPTQGDITQNINGKTTIKAISCASRHDPDAALSISKICAIWVHLGPGLWVSGEVYQQYMPLLPNLHDHFARLFSSPINK